MAGMAGLAYLGHKHRLGLTGYTTQGGYEKARQDRINMKRQTNINKTLQSKNYAPGWREKAFKKVQQLGKNLNLVDAADAGTAYDGGQGGQPDRGQPGSPPTGTAGRNPWGRARGGLAGLWQR